MIFRLMIGKRINIWLGFDKWRLSICSLHFTNRTVKGLVVHKVRLLVDHFISLL
jgi:hypothetical protein